MQSILIRTFYKNIILVCDTLNMIFLFSLKYRRSHINHRYSLAAIVYGCGGDQPREKERTQLLDEATRWDMFMTTSTFVRFSCTTYICE